VADLKLKALEVADNLELLYPTAFVTKIESLVATATPDGKMLKGNADMIYETVVSIAKDIANINSIVDKKMYTKKILRKYPLLRLDNSSFPRFALDLKSRNTFGSVTELTARTDKLSEEIADIFLTLYPNKLPVKRKSLGKSVVFSDRALVRLGLIAFFIKSFRALDKNKPAEESHKVGNAVQALQFVVANAMPIARNLQTNYKSISDLAEQIRKLEKEVGTHMKDKRSITQQMETVEASIKRMENWNKDSLAYKSGKLTKLLEKKKRTLLDLQNDLEGIEPNSIMFHALTSTKEKKVMLEQTILTDTKLLKAEVLELTKLLNLFLGIEVRTLYMDMVKQPLVF